MPRRQVKEVPRWRRGQPQPSAPAVKLSPRQEKALVALHAKHLATQAATGQAQLAAVPGVNGFLAKTGTYRFRRHLPPFLWLGWVLAWGLGTAARDNVRLALVVAALTAGGIWLLTRHLPDFTRKCSYAMAAGAGLWIPALSLTGFAPHWPHLLVGLYRALVLGSMLAVAAVWVRHCRFRPAEAEPAAPSLPMGDVAIWARLAAKNRWEGHLSSHKELPDGGRQWHIVLNGAETHIGQVMSEPRKIAAAWGKSITEAYAEPSPDGIESSGRLTILPKNTLEQSRQWDRSPIDHETGIAVIGWFPDGKPAHERYFIRRNGIRHTIVGGADGSGKALALDTPVPTPAGWTTMGDLGDGDQVYDETGSLCRVVTAWPARHGRPCYEVRFSDGSAIVADADHRWLVDTYASRASEGRARRRTPDRNQNLSRDQAHKRNRPEVLTTAEMLDSVRTARGQVNYSIRVAAPLAAADASLPIPPYTLGAWLGDGTSKTGSLTSADAEVIAEILAETQDIFRNRRAAPQDLEAWPPQVTMPVAAQAIGMSLHQAYAWAKTGKFPAEVIPRHPVMVTTASIREFLENERLVWREPWATQPGCESYRVKGLSAALRDTGLIRNKHIPVAYLRASEAQRRALLAGLLDTDGYCGKQQGEVEFYNKNERLARDVLHLVCSLGYKATIRSKRATLRGKDCGIVWIVQFTPGDKVFRLTRKLARQVTKTGPTSRHRYITEIRPVPSVPVRCITVDSPSSLYLVSESCIPTHNTGLLDLGLCLSATSGIITPVILDPQEGQALPAWREHVPYASGVPECMAYLYGLQLAMLDRSRYLAGLTWEAPDGSPRKGFGFFDPFMTGLPIVEITLDEAPALLADPKWGTEAVLLLGAIGKMGRKVGFRLRLGVQVPSLAELGGSQALRSMLVGGNVFCGRAGDKVTGGMIGISADPSVLPKYFPDGKPTVGLGYTSGPDNRPSTPMRWKWVEDPYAVAASANIRPMDDRCAAAMERGISGSAVAVPLPGAAPLAAVPPPADEEPAPPGRTASDAILAVLDEAGGELDKGEVVVRAGKLVTGKWGRAKPFHMRTWSLALADLESTRQIAKPRHGTYAPIRTTIHAVSRNDHETTEATGA